MKFLASLGALSLLWIVAIGLVACSTPQPVPPSAQRPTPSSTAKATVTPPPAPSVPAVAPGSVPAPVQAPVTPAIDKIAVLTAWVDQQARLYRVAAPLLTANTELCPQHARSLLGFTAKTQYSYSEEFVDAARTALGLEDRLHVMDVLTGSGASIAGVRKGDILLAAGIEPLPQGPDAERAAATLVASEIQGRTDIHLTILRDGDRVVLDVPLTSACAMVIDPGNSDDASSYADGHRILITRGLLNFTRSDEELAYAIAREMAHNVLAPSPRPDMEAIIDRLLTLTADRLPASPDAAIAPFPPVLDAAADKLALYMLARAGYDIGNALHFWKRLAEAYPATNINGHTALHPSTNDRLSVIAAVVKSIEMKQNNHLPLVP